MKRPSETLPSLPLAGWTETCTTLHLWTQIVGKIRLALAPMVNHRYLSEREFRFLTAEEVRTYAKDRKKTPRTDEYYGNDQDEHLTPEHVRVVQPRALSCEDCLKTGEHRVHLRICTECGHVGCYDQSPNRHATRHFHATHHPIVHSFEPSEEWGYCYVDDQYFETMGPPANTYDKHFGKTNK